MPYPKRLLNDGEEVALDLKPHWQYFTKHIVTGVPLLIVFILIFSGTSDSTRTVLMWLWVAAALAWAVWLGVKYMNWNFTHFVVTSDRVIFRTGAISKHEVTIPLEQITNINFNQRIWERIVGAGDLEIESAGKDAQSRFDDVRHPDAVRQEINHQRDLNARKRAAWANPGSAAPAAAPTPGGAGNDASIPEQLEKLAALRDRGIITAAEFETKKAQLLERM